ncbi:endonuclease [Brevifollis gellanilyticus]|uniref:Endonuclease n=2 Tax=Brevifollis gellanilyticus TaxID=748831 RepID=A0A512MFX8_9BACT|nr:endonuclease [Brevifollis gellanilyticus]
MTYNVHSGVGTDGKLDLARIAEVIASQEPDVVALQELDVSRARSGRAHQARIIAEHLDMCFHFHPAQRIQEEEEYGDAILSRWPMHLRQAAELPTVQERLAFEPRGALWASVEVHGRPVQVMNTHLGLSNNERIKQIDALLGPEWLAHPDCGTPSILCGDFNALPYSRVHRKACHAMTDTQRAVPGRRARATFPSRWPLLRLDYIFISQGLKCQSTRVVNTPLARLASDHLPLVAEVEFTTAI